jgi:predicted Zn-dependent protease
MKVLAGVCFARVTSKLFTLKFNREQETDADLTGMQLFHRAEIDPSATIRFFERLSEKDEG